MFNLIPKLIKKGCPGGENPRQKAPPGSKKKLQKKKERGGLFPPRDLPSPLLETFSPIPLPLF